MWKSRCSAVHRVAVERALQHVCVARCVEFDEVGEECSRYKLVSMDMKIGVTDSLDFGDFGEIEWSGGVEYID